MAHALRGRKRRQQAYLQHMDRWGYSKPLGTLAKSCWREGSYCHLVDDAGDAAQGLAGRTPHMEDSLLPKQELTRLWTHAVQQNHVKC